MDLRVRRRVRACVGIGVLTLGLGSLSPAGATTIQVGGPIGGNDCSGVFGQGFQNCVIPANTVPGSPASPVIIQFEFSDDPTFFNPTAINSSLFPTISGDEFSFNPFGCESSQIPGGFEGEAGACGSWNYNPASDDPAALVTFWVAKGGPNFNLLTDNSGTAVTTGIWFTPVSDEERAGLLHITFYDTGVSPPQPMPEPGSLLLVGAALAALGLTRGRRT